MAVTAESPRGIPLHAPGFPGDQAGPTAAAQPQQSVPRSDLCYFAPHQGLVRPGTGQSSNSGLWREGVGGGKCWIDAKYRDWCDPVHVSEMLGSVRRGGGRVQMLGNN